jgi:hypothetical protein
MGKKARQNRTVNRGRSRRAGKGKPKGKVTPMPAAPDTTQGDGGEVEAPPKVRKRLNAKQALAAQLMQARGVIVRKNVALANLSTAHTKEIAELRSEIAQLRAENFQAQINAENRENELLAREHGLPEGNFNFQKDDKGWYVEYDAPVVDGLEAPDPEEEPEDPEEDPEEEPEEEPEEPEEEEPEARKDEPEEGGATPPESAASQPVPMPPEPATAH